MEGSKSISYGMLLGDIVGIGLMINHMWIAATVLCCLDIILSIIIDEKNEFLFGVFLGLSSGALLIIIMDYFCIENKLSGIMTLLILDVMSIVHARS